MTPRPAAPPSICAACWEGPFASRLGLFSERIEFAGFEGGRLVLSGGYSYTTSWAEVQARAKTGCLWCQLVLAAGLKEAYREEDRMRAPLIVHVGIQGGESPRSCTPKGTQHLAVYVNGQLCTEGYVYTTPDDPTGSYIVARNRVLDVGSSHSLSLAKASIDECVRGHRRCVPPRTSPAPLLPTRLVDCADPSHPRLVTTQGCRGEYVALSYVWGEAQPHSTTTLNVSTYKHGIDPACLPKTIRDAIHVTHALGIRYLWADSLCIIQDSTEDKQREIGRMRHVYRDAYLTVVASCAQRVSKGFLQDRPPAPATEDDTFSRDITLPFLCPSSPGGAAENAAGQLGEIRFSPIYMPLAYDNWSGQPAVQYNPAMEPISSRGWCMQELLMSPRSLLFAFHTLQYRCQTTTENIGGAYHDMLHEMRLPDLLFLEDAPLVEYGSKAWKTLRFAWGRVLADYTRRSITVPSDKLLACGGIAEEFQRILRSEYLAGIWRDTLLPDLVWSKMLGTSAEPRPREYRAPSWSWAAIDGPINPGVVDEDWISDGWTGAAEVVRCEVVLKDATLPFGQVTGASLVLRTHLVQCLWNTERPNLLCRTLPRNETGNLRITAPEDIATEGLAERFAMGHIDSEDDADIHEVWAVPLYWREDGMAGIVTALAEDSEDDSVRSAEVLKRYRRIGYFDTMTRPDNSVEWLETLPLMEIELV